jgi:hypothetical protein
MNGNAEKLVIIAPDHLVAKVEAAFRRVSPLRKEGGRDLLVLPASALKMPLMRADIVIAPKLDGALHWARRQREGWPNTTRTASFLLAKMANTVARTGAAVVREDELKNEWRLREAVRAARTRATATTHDLRPRLASRLAMAPLIGPGPTPLRVFGELPVLRGAYAWWPLFQFLSGFKRCPLELDIMGRPRTLIYGPYLNLPAGRWQVEVAFGLCEAAAGYDYLIEFGTNADMARVRYRPGRGGEHSVALAYDVRDYSPVEIRISLLRAAFHGQIRLVGAWIRKLDDPRRSNALLSLATPRAEPLPRPPRDRTILTPNRWTSGVIDQPELAQAKHVHRGGRGGAAETGDLPAIAN